MTKGQAALREWDDLCEMHAAHEEEVRDASRFRDFIHGDETDLLPEEDHAMIRAVEEVSALED